MSKLTVRRQLSAMPREAIVEMLMEAYSARKEIKEYLDFFAEPDVERLECRYRQAISKEFDRIGRGGNCKAKVTVLRRLLREFASYRPGTEAVIGLDEFFLRTALEAERVVNFSESQMRCVAAVMRHMVETAELALCIDAVMPRLLAVLADETRGSRYFRRYLRQELDGINIYGG